MSTKSEAEELRKMQIYIPSIPIAQPRHRIGVVAGKGRAFGAKTSHPIHAFKATARMAASQVCSGPPLSGPLRVDLLFVLPRPKNKTWKTKPMPREWHEKKPDKDNLEKGCLDALTGIVWVDDAQIADGRTIKVIASGDEVPHVEVTVEQLRKLTCGSSAG